jgi:methanogenic corrinoid protein MtbC1
MAEGVAGLNQQVVNTGYWDRSERLAQHVDVSALNSKMPLEDRPSGRSPRTIRRAVEADIIPRLLLSVRAAKIEPPPAPAAEAGLTAADILRFAELLLTEDDDAVLAAHIEAIQARGFLLDQVYLHLFQPTARHIGELWCADLCSFVDVTLALGTMQKLLRTFGPDFHKTGRAAEGARHALLVPLPGDQHTFGLSIVAEFFRRAGWNVWSTPFASPEGLAEAVRTSWFTVVGFSASSDERLDELAATIRLVRRDSCNGAIGVLVGGPVFLDHPDRVAWVGADAWGADARQALDQAESILALRTGS